MASFNDLLCLEQSICDDDDVEVLQATLRSLERPRGSATGLEVYQNKIAANPLLPCCRRPVVCRTLNGVSDNRVLSNLLAFDVKCRRSCEDFTSGDYFASGLQPDLEPYMRDVVTAWMLEV